MIDNAIARAMSWFQIHADQRMKLMNFFVILLAGSLALIGTAIKDNNYLLEIVVGASIVITTFVFKNLDRRTASLIKDAENALNVLEGRMSSGRRLGDDLHVCFNPEFLREGSSIEDFWSPPYTISGANTDQGHQVIEEIYGSISQTIIRLDTAAAETIKYLCNIFHALKIGFANEVGSTLKQAGINASEVMEVFCQDTKLNISSAYLRPGFAFGGSCLPKDLRAFVTYAQKQGLQIPILSNILASNEEHFNRALQMILSHDRGSVALFGLAFKPGTDDLRESPLVTLAERLIGKGYSLRIVDHHVNAARIMGLNKEFIEKEIPHFGELLIADALEAVTGADLIVAGFIEEGDFGAIEKGYSGQAIFDLCGYPRLQELGGKNYQGLCW